MFKKFLCLTAALVFVSACDTVGVNEGEGGAHGSAGTIGSMGRIAEPNTASTARLGTQEDMVVNVGDRVFFAFDKSDLSSQAQATLDRQATWLKRYADANVVIEGHADERGTREYNLALGERRATAAKNYLIAGGINASRIKTVSYGKERPAVVGNNEAAWAQNRRAVTVVTQQ
ncbi:MAG: peptidoglycan-associated lipoprotein Pal [Alphaproteobacteria bacterium]|nr:peptidoglycan-associated lipoprotein Pal [Alphaproteobacteria bacterium]